MGLGFDGQCRWEWTRWIEVVGVSWCVSGGGPGWDKVATPSFELQAGWESANE